MINVILKQGTYTKLRNFYPFKEVQTDILESEISGTNEINKWFSPIY